MDDTEPSHVELICGLLAVMPARYVAKIANRLAMIYGDTGHGEDACVDIIAAAALRRTALPSSMPRALVSDPGLTPV